MGKYCPVRKTAGTFPLLALRNLGALGVFRALHVHALRLASLLVAAPYSLAPRYAASP
jgi:hypothetical protein